MVYICNVEWLCLIVYNVTILHRTTINKKLGMVGRKKSKMCKISLNVLKFNLTTMCG